MTLAEAQTVAVRIFGAGTTLLKVNGVCTVERQGRRIGAGPSWKAALRAAALDREAVTDLREGVKKQLKQERREQVQKQALKVALAVTGIAGAIAFLVLR